MVRGQELCTYFSAVLCSPPPHPLAAPQGGPTGDTHCGSICTALHWVPLEPVERAQEVFVMMVEEPTMLLTCQPLGVGRVARS